MTSFRPIKSKWKACADFLHKPFFTDYRTIAGLWVLMCVFTIIKHQQENNFVIFAAVWKHTIEQLPLYVYYPAEYIDVNLYGPVFSLVVAPFAVLPRPADLFCWLLFLCACLFLSVRRSNFTRYQQLFVLWFCTHELLTALLMSQFNVVVAATIVMSFMLIERQRDFWAAFIIVLGTLIKLYSIVGLAFFLFSRHKGRLVLSLLFWGVVLFAAPMLISSPEYIVQQYADWFDAIVTKNDNNINGIAGDMGEPTTNISLLGMVRKISGCTAYSDLWIMVPGMMLFALPYLRFSQYKNLAFREMILASVLMFCVLFSSSSENSTYIIAFVGVAVWYSCVPWKRTGWDIALMVFVFVLSSLSPGDLFPAYLRTEYVRPYALKALPVSLVWLKLSWEMLTRDYAEEGSTPSSSLKEMIIRLSKGRLSKFFDKSFITFLIVGVVNTLFGTAIMFILYNAFGCSYWVSSFCDYFFGSILSYFLNKHFTFHYQGSTWQSIVRFALNIVVCYLIAYSVALPLTRYVLQSMQLSTPVVENIAMLVGTVLFMLINYAGQKF